MTSMQEKQSGIQRRTFCLASASMALLSASGCMEHSRDPSYDNFQQTSRAQFKLLAGDLNFNNSQRDIAAGLTYRDGKAGQARFYNPVALAQQANGDLWVCDTDNHVLRRIKPDGAVDTYGDPTTRGTQGGSKTTAQFKFPIGLAIYTQNGDELMFVADREGSQIRGINLSTMGDTQDWGQPTTTAATPVDGPLGQATFPYPEKICAQYQRDGSVVLWEASLDGRLRRIANAGVSTVTSQDRQSVYGLVASSDFSIFLATDRTIFRYRDGKYEIFAGSLNEYGVADGSPEQARFQSVTGMTIDGQGNLYVNTLSGVRKVTPEGRVSTVLSSQDWVDLVGADSASLTDLLMTGPNTMAVTAGNAVGILTLP